MSCSATTRSGSARTARRSRSPTPMSPTPTAGPDRTSPWYPIEAGEQLTERQALQALLLPSANNIAAVLAQWDAGSASRFVARMNATARSLGMTHTRYTDPSGYDDATVSTAADQVRIVDRAMRLPVFAASSPRRARRCRSPAPCRTPTRCWATTGSSASRPARTVRPAAASPSGRSAGSTAGGRRSPGSCWASPAITEAAAGLAAADALVDRIAGQGAVPSAPQPTDSPQPTPAPGARPRMTPGTLPRIHARQEQPSSSRDEGEHDE